MPFFKQDIKFYPFVAGAVLEAMAQVERVYRQHGYPLTITSVRDGKHMKASLHYEGLAFDCRTVRAGINAEKARMLAEDIQRVLGQDWDVVVERDHIHIELDPEKPSVNVVPSLT